MVKKIFGILWLFLCVPGPAVAGAQTGPLGEQLQRQPLVLCAFPEIRKNTDREMRAFAIDVTGIFMLVKESRTSERLFVDISIPGKKWRLAPNCLDSGSPGFPPRIVCTCTEKPEKDRPVKAPAHCLLEFRNTAGTVLVQAKANFHYFHVPAHKVVYRLHKVLSTDRQKQIEFLRRAQKKDKRKTGFAALAAVLFMHKNYEKAVRYSVSAHREISRLLKQFREHRLLQAEYMCQIQRPEKKKVLFAALADVLLNHGAYKEAAEYLIRADSSAREAGYRRLGDVYFFNRLYKRAASVYEKICPAPRLGRAYELQAEFSLRAKDLISAESFYQKALQQDQTMLKSRHFSEKEKSPFIRRLARVYGLLGDLYFRAGKLAPAQEEYEKAVQYYRIMVKDPRFAWPEIDNSRRLHCISRWESRKKSPAEIQRHRQLKKVLHQSAMYCSRLFNVSFDFVCLEKTSQQVGKDPDLSLSLGIQRLRLHDFQALNSWELVYDYRLIRKNRCIREIRTLVRKNGRKVRAGKAEISRRALRVEKIIFAPVAMLAEKWQNHFFYLLLGRERLGKTDTLVVDVLPRQPLKVNPIFGKVWIHAKNGSVVKIELNPKSLENFQEARQLALNHQGIPRIDMVVEYGVCRQGICFPSRYFLKDMYVNRKGKPVIRAKQTYLYQKYHFFSINSEVRYSGDKKL